MEKPLTQKREQQRRKAFLAIIFASSILQPALPARCENKVDYTDSAIQHLVHNTEMKPEVRAANLLRLAWCYLSDTPISAVEMQFYNIRSDLWLLSNPERWENSIQGWADQIVTDNQSTINGLKANAVRKSALESRQRLNLSNSAIQQAVAQLQRAPSGFAKLNLYFIASKLFERIGNSNGMKSCNKVIEASLAACEKINDVDVEQIRAVASVLNLKANDLVPIRIQDPSYPWHSSTKQKPFTQKDFEQSERLKLNAVNVLDKLPNTDHVRRKAHRDLALWYMELGKKDKAEQQKQILFKLVGVKDDGLLYPQNRRCGHLVWWEKSKSVGVATGACGMG